MPVLWSSCGLPQDAVEALATCGSFESGEAPKKAYGTTLARAGRSSDENIVGRRCETRVRVIDVTTRAFTVVGTQA
jgi:hypothetical protein